MDAFIWFGSIGALAIWSLWDVALFIWSKHDGGREWTQLRDAIFLAVLAVCDGLAAAKSEAKIHHFEAALAPRTLNVTDFDRGWNLRIATMANLPIPDVVIAIRDDGNVEDLAERQGLAVQIQTALGRHGWSAQIRAHDNVMSAVCGDHGIDVTGPNNAKLLVEWSFMIAGMGTGGGLAPGTVTNTPLQITICRGPH